MQQVRRQADEALMRVLRDAVSPVGARHARISLLADGFDVSEATVSRMLRDFDSQGWTTSVGRKGRILTSQGRQHAAQTHEQEHVTRQVRQAIGVRTVQDLVNLLHARRTVERETAREAALSATKSDVAHLREIIAAHEDCVVHARPGRYASIEFHRAVAALAPNHFIRAMTELILTGRLERLGTILDFIVSSTTEESKTEAEYHAIVDEHRAIVDAIESGNAAEAESRMEQHMQQFIDRAERYLVGTPGILVDRYIKLLEDSNFHPSRDKC